MSDQTVEPIARRRLPGAWVGRVMAILVLVAAGGAILALGRREWSDAVQALAMAVIWTWGAAHWWSRPVRIPAWVEWVPLVAAGVWIVLEVLDHR